MLCAYSFTGPKDNLSLFFSNEGDLDLSYAFFIFNAF